MDLCSISLTYANEGMRPNAIAFSDAQKLLNAGLRKNDSFKINRQAGLMLRARSLLFHSYSLIMLLRRRAKGYRTEVRMKSDDYRSL